MIQPSSNFPSELTMDITDALKEHFHLTHLQDTCLSPASDVEIAAVVQAVFESKANDGKK